MAKERTNVKFLGRILGTHTGWDGSPGEFWYVYDFVPAPGIGLPACDTLNINEENGDFESSNGDSPDANQQTFDIITILKDIPKSV